MAVLYSLIGKCTFYGDKHFLFNVHIMKSVHSLAGVGEIQSSSAGSGYHDEFRHLNLFSDSLSKQYTPISALSSVLS